MAWATRKTVLENKLHNGRTGVCRNCSGSKSLVTLCRSRKPSRSNTFSKTPKSAVRTDVDLLRGAHPSREGGKKVSTKDKRWYKDVGLGFKTPSDAIHGTYIGMFVLIPPRTTRRGVRRQEMSFYRRHLDPRANLDGQGRLN